MDYSAGAVKITRPTAIVPFAPNFCSPLIAAPGVRYLHCCPKKGVAMNERSVVSCRWACLTLSLPHPLWISSEDQPWTCVRGSVPRLLDDTAVCRDCPNWEPRAGLSDGPGRVAP